MSRKHETLTIQDRSEPTGIGVEPNSTLHATLIELAKRGRKVLGFERYGAFSGGREWRIKLMAVA